ncbi:hypothetical protein ESY87_19435 [Subsaximicrobium wynnwilliamsii]|uniref:hypothetical protein n=1 Tax=Subsaximicrobium wynnwilliamsii TaxID=291179 RepID=UPI0011C2A514|nr:hypothetical protein [Subsaximicrobium wynnwilliamsii]TXD81064.1 hypothetical protein ESY87_19435 [Subsaximicrobium wynnwilliamsii]
MDLRKPINRNKTNGIKFGLVNCLISIGIGIFIIKTGFSPNGNVILITSTLAIFLCGLIFWNLLKVKTGSKAILAGVLTGLMSHPLTWFLLIIINNSCHFFHLNCSAEYIYSDGTITASNIIGEIFGGTVMSLLFFGYITIFTSSILSYLFFKYTEWQD